MIQQILSERLVNALGWTLVHALWQAALFALLLGVLLLALRKFSARARYNMSIGMLGAFFLTAALTFTQLYRTSSAPMAVDTNIENATPAAPTEGFATSAGAEFKDSPAKIVERTVMEEVQPSAIQAQEAQPTEVGQATLLERIGQYYGKHLPLIVTLWLMGVLILQLRFLGQLAYIQRLKNYGVERFPSRFAPMLQELETQLKLSKPVRYLSSFRIASPFTAGWLRPVVLFPAALLDQLNEPELRTIIAHELAHIRRHDFLVNLIQTLLCILFFYHPAVWWMSARIEEEREHCCDDLAIQVTGERVGYAKTLLQLKESELNPALAMNLLGQGGFKQRITRLLSGALGTGTYREGFVSALILAGILASAIGLSGQSTNLPVDPSEMDLTLDTEQPNEAEADVAELPMPAPAANTNPETGESLISATTLPDEIAAFTNDSTVFGFLLEAIDDGNMPLVKYFLDQGVDLNQEDENGWFPLAVAAGEGKPDILSLLLAKGAEVNYLNRRGFTALIEAADEGAYDCAKILLDGGADLSLKGSNFKRDALSMAASEGHLDVMQLLLDKGANMNTTSITSSTNDEGYPLHEAAEEGNINIVNFLVQSGVKPNLEDDEGRTPLSYAAEEGHKRIVEYLLQNGANPNDFDNDHRSAMSYAAEEGFPTIIKLLYQYGGSHQGKDNSGRTAMDYAVEELADLGNESIDGHDIPRGRVSGQVTWSNDGRGLDEVVRLLSGKGALADGVTVDADGRVIIKLEDLQKSFYVNPGERPQRIYDRDSQEKSGASTDLGNLVQLVEDNQLDRLKQRLEAGADPDQHGKDNYTPLTMAARDNNIAAAQLLLEAGADPDHENFNGVTAIDIALRDNLVDFLRLLNENGGAVTADRPDGSSPLDAAARDGNTKVMEYLLEQGTNVNGGSGPSPLFYAARENMVKSVRLLLDNGADTERRCNTRDTDYFRRNYPGAGTTIAIYEGVTPLLAAITDQSEESLRLLVKSGANVNARCRKYRYLSTKQLSWRVAGELTKRELSSRFEAAYEVTDWTPLLEAVESSNVKLVKILLAAGAQKDYESSNGITALSLAREIGNQEVVRLLE